MACCIAVAYLFGVIRRGVLRLLPAGDVSEAQFAPPARRPAPGLRVGYGD